MKETLRHQEAFDYYYSLGEKRSYPQVALKFTVSRTSVKKWSKAFGWLDRIVKRDKKNATALANKTDKQIVQQDAQNIKIARAAIKVFAQSLIGHIEHTCGCGNVTKIPVPKAKLTADQFDKMVRLEKFIMGEPDSYEERKLIIEYRDPVPRVKAIESEVIENVD